MQRFLKLFEPYLQWFYRCCIDAVTRGQGPDGARFRNAKELQTAVLQASRAAAKTAKRKARVGGHSKR